MSWPTPVLAHSAGSADEAVATLLALGLVVVLNAFLLLGRRSAAARRRRWGLVPLGVLMLVGIVTARSWVPVSKPSKIRPATTAQLRVLSPENGATTGRDVEVRLRLTGGRLVTTASTKLKPNVGHLHFYVDNKLLSMTSTLDEKLNDLPPGPHQVRAEFVANDHGPFKNRVTAAALFRVAT